MCIKQERKGKENYFLHTSRAVHNSTCSNDMVQFCTHSVSDNLWGLRYGAKQRRVWRCKKASSKIFQFLPFLISWGKLKHFLSIKCWPFYTQSLSISTNQSVFHCRSIITGDYIHMFSVNHCNMKIDLVCKK